MGLSRIISIGHNAAARSNDIDVVRGLFAEYWASFGFEPSFQNFSQEMADLPGRYAPPGGRLALATFNGEPAGCGALRPICESACEAKRLYVRAPFRGRGIGRDLLKWLIFEARNAGYRQLFGDTMPSMNQALRMYEGFGFQRVSAYSAAPTPEAIYLRLELDSAHL